LRLRILLEHYAKQQHQDSTTLNHATHGLTHRPLPEMFALPAREYARQQDFLLPDGQEQNQAALANPKSTSQHRPTRGVLTKNRQNS
jgi:hypothetical protein